LLRELITTDRFISDYGGVEIISMKKMRGEEHEITVRWSRMQLLGNEKTENNEFKPCFSLVFSLGREKRWRQRTAGGRTAESRETRIIPCRKTSLQLTTYLSFSRQIKKVSVSLLSR